MRIEDAFEESFRELGIDLDGDTDDILPVTVESDETLEAGDEPNANLSVGKQSSGEDASAEDADDTYGSDKPVIDVLDGAVLRLPDGTEVDASQAVLLQKDYTKKTQQLAEERRQFDAQREQVAQAYEEMRGWYEERAQNPTAWVQEIVAGTDDPTATIARALYELASQGALDANFVATFGIDAGDVAEKAQTSARDEELSAIKRRLEDREQAEQYAAYQQQQVRAQVAYYQSQWGEIVKNHGLAFESPDAERNAKREVLEFAIENGLANSLINAYDVMLVRKGQVSSQSKPESRVADPAVAAKKRASRAVAQRSGGAGAAAATVAKPKSTREAALEAIAEFAER